MTTQGISKPAYTPVEEFLNALTHGIGALLSSAGLVVMIWVAMIHGGGMRLAVALIFGISLIVEYTASTIYHAVSHPTAKRHLRVVDHACIYLLIAGSYTPFMLVSLMAHDGMTLMVVVALIAVAGVVLEVLWRNKPHWVSALCYVAMGWVIIVRLPHLISALHTNCLALLVAGGISYSVGALFYLFKRIPFTHSIFHLFVLGGSICQFLAVVLYVL